jgi:hypothetical protein
VNLSGTVSVVQKFTVYSYPYIERDLMKYSDFFHCHLFEIATNIGWISKASEPRALRHLDSCFSRGFFFFPGTANISQMPRTKMEADISLELASALVSNAAQA